MFDQRPFKRTDRVSDKVRLAVSEVLLKNISLSNTGLITVTRVDISKDLRYARIYFSHIDTGFSSIDLEKKLNQNKSKIRYHLGLILQAQFVPQLVFRFDERYAKSAKIEDLLNKIKKNK